VDPAAGKITVLFLEGSEYQLHGEFVSGQKASSRLLPTFAIDVAAALEAK
jgi:hypothetical protein